MSETSYVQERMSKSNGNEASPLLRYTLRGLRSCWMPAQGRWSHIYHLDGRSHPNESVPESDVFYTLNVLLGFSRISHLSGSHDFNLPEIFQKNVVLMTEMNSPKYAYGMALWAAAELEMEIPAETWQRIGTVIADRRQWPEFRAQDLGMILIGCVQQAQRCGRRQLGAIADELFVFLEQRYCCSSGLFFDTAQGLRRNFSSFATNTYLTLASYLYGEWRGNPRALAVAKSATKKLIQLQGPEGEWPWFFYTPKGRVVDFYEVYSVHQQGMAPAFLECAERHEVAGASEALRQGFQWIFGQNQMKRSMLWKDEGMICRSQIRKGELHNRRKRAVRAAVNALLGRSASLIDPARIELRLECRSYELGWILWSFGQRKDLPEITSHPDLL